MKKIYLLTTVHIGDPIWQWGQLCIERKRSVGWFSSYSDAEEIVRKNIGDIYEAGHYDHCVIEELYYGLYPTVIKERWFEWLNGRYQQIKKPLGLEKVTNFGIG